MLTPSIKNLDKSIPMFLNKLLFIIVLSIGIHYLLNKYHLAFLRLPIFMVIFLASAIGLLLGFKLNAAYRRWLKAISTLNQLAAHARMILSSLSLFSKKRFKADAKKQVDLLMYKQIAYVKLVILQLCDQKEEDYNEEVWSKLINEQKIFSEAEIEILEQKTNKASYLLLNQIHAVIQFSNRYSPPPEFIGESMKIFYELDRLYSELMKIRLVPFPRGYAICTTALVWLFPVIFALSEFNSDYFHDVVVGFISTVLITLNTVATNFTVPFSNRRGNVILNKIAALHEQIILENLDVPTDISLFFPAELMAFCTD